MQQHYVHHVLRMPLGAWPDPVNRTLQRISIRQVYVPMQGPSELGASGKLVGMGSTAEPAGASRVPTLAIGARHDTMDPAHMARDGAQSAARAATCDCPDGSHMAMYDDQERYFAGPDPLSAGSGCGRKRARAPPRDCIAQTATTEKSLQKLRTGRHGGTHADGLPARARRHLC